ncbi:hypothetical protein DFA_05317 [Cavenderia fasciculata]|uniref:Carbohydrate binding domain-containing protein n=1 Tax=Cavenderia fasciculata TaxID=261658 RepID=F4PKW3_CACFS|nr:uncharacterized protein DFA_05317 [Cavenderia fasciculata]EGG23185.1 hypothetical protein DFA_05317 [Cavenderia fasciculata]|eukprot:XP_004361036.1 hypothetical protein DFA_05317 [Cavenderia fasciculata]
MYKTIALLVVIIASLALAYSAPLEGEWIYNIGSTPSCNTITFNITSNGDGTFAGSYTYAGKLVQVMRSVNPSSSYSNVTFAGQWASYPAGSPIWANFNATMNNDVSFTMKINATTYTLPKQSFAVLNRPACQLQDY